MGSISNTQCTKKEEDWVQKFYTGLEFDFNIIEQFLKIAVEFSYTLVNVLSTS